MKFNSSCQLWVPSLSTVGDSSCINTTTIFYVKWIAREYAAVPRFGAVPSNKNNKFPWFLSPFLHYNRGSFAPKFRNFATCITVWQFLASWVKHFTRVKQSKLPKTSPIPFPNVSKQLWHFWDRAAPLKQNAEQIDCRKRNANCRLWDWPNQSIALDSLFPQISCRILPDQRQAHLSNDKFYGRAGQLASDYGVRKFVLAKSAYRVGSVWKRDEVEWVNRKGTKWQVKNGKIKTLKKTYSTSVAWPVFDVALWRQTLSTV